MREKMFTTRTCGASWAWCTMDQSAQQVTSYTLQTGVKHAPCICLTCTIFFRRLIAEGKSLPNRPHHIRAVQHHVAEY